MDKLQHEFKGILLECTLDGVIKKVIRDDLNLSSIDPVGRPLPGIVTPEYRHNALDFIVTSKQKHIAWDIKLAIYLLGHSELLHFTGISLDDSLWVIGAASPSEALYVLDQLQQLNNEQANQIRELFKEVGATKETDTNTPDEQNQLAEFSLLNNELVNLQRELAKKNAELERLSQIKNQFLGMAAHDLRSPLSNIMSFADFLIEETEGVLSEQHREFLTIIYSSSEYMRTLIEDLLDVSQIESGSLHIKTQKGDLASFVNRVIKANAPLAKRKNINTAFRSDPDCIKVSFDHRRMEQVINNLLSNAIKFSKKGSTIRVMLSGHDDHVVLSVSDEGIGMTPSEVEHLFTPFTKSSRKGTTGEKGTGLGLYIVKRIVDDHQGEINVVSEPGKGTKVSITLPA